MLYYQEKPLNFKNIIFACFSYFFIKILLRILMTGLVNSDRVLERSGKKAALKDVSGYMKLNFNLLHEKFTLLNNEHDESIINSINIRAKAYTIVENEGDDPNHQTRVDQLYETSSQIRKETAETVQDLATRFVKRMVIKT